MRRSLKRDSSHPSFIEVWIVAKQVHEWMDVQAMSIPRRISDLKNRELLKFAIRNYIMRFVYFL